MEKERSIKSDILLRVRLLYAVFIFLGAVVLTRIVWVQAFSGEVAHNAEALAGRIFTVDSLSARRGGIFARGGEPLAVSIFRYQPLFDFGSRGLDSVELFNEQSDSLSKLLAAYFGDKSESAYRMKFRNEHARRYRVGNRRDTTVLRSEGRFARWLDGLLDRRYVVRTIYDTLRDHTPVAVFPRPVDYTEWQELKQYPLLNWNMGMVYTLDESDQRIYPQGDLLRRTIGLSGDRGHYGIEEAYRETLAGRNGVAKRQRIARGFAGRIVDGGNEDPVDGADIVTTIDLDIQDVADKALRQRLESQNAVWGTTIVMEVATGDILAMVNLGRNADGSYSEREDYALKYAMEPGSTLKLVSMLTLLEDAGMPMSKVYDTNDGRKTDVGPARGKLGIQDSHGGFRDMDFLTAAAQSSNVYFAKAVWEYYGETGKKQQYSDFLRNRLHLHETVGLEMLGEMPPTVTADWKVSDPGLMLVKMSYGYRIKMAPIQMITLYNAVANGGCMVAPRLIREVRRGNSVLDRPKVRTIEEHIASPQTIREVRRCLEEVCLSGTGKPYFGDTTLFRAAGKTGTAQIVDDRHKLENRCYLGSMVAFFPAENPRYTVLTTIETRLQAGKAFYGGPLAGPVTKRVATYLFNRDRQDDRGAGRSGRCYPQRLKGGDADQIRRVAGKLSPHVDAQLRHGWGRAEVDSLSRVTVAPLDDDPGVMPDVRGMGLKDALFLLENRGLAVRSTGKGTVVQQSVAPGSRVVRGATVTITLK